MKKAISVLLVLVMVMSLAACSKNETPTNQDNTTVTQAPDPTKEAEPTKPATTPEPTSTPTPTPTPEPTATPVPTEAPVDDIPDDDFDEFGDEYATGYEGIWQCDDCILQIDREGVASILTFFYEETDITNYGGYIQYWANYSDDKKIFDTNGIPGRYFYYEDGEQFSEEVDDQEPVEVVGDNLVWGDMIFEKISDDTSDNPYYRNPYDDDYYSGDVGDGFGAEFSLEHPDTIDVIATIFYGVYRDCWNYTDVSLYYPYYGDEMSMDTMDEFDAAYLELGTEGDQGHLCFLEKGINGDIQWAMEEGTIKVIYVPSGEEYTGLFYWDSEDDRPYVCLRIDEYDVWMSYKTEVVAKPNSILTDEVALSAIESYCLGIYPNLQSMVDNDEYNISWGIDSSTDDEVKVYFRSYTGAYVYYYVDRNTGETHMTEFMYGMTETEKPLDGTINIWDYYQK